MKKKSITLLRVVNLSLRKSLILQHLPKIWKTQVSISNNTIKYKEYNIRQENKKEYKIRQENKKEYKILY